MGAGLKQLSPEEFERFAALNAAYREKFGFPFIICVRLNTKTSILAAFSSRLGNDARAEREEALMQIGLITKLRLQDLAKGSST
jgi:2-oxo-4-hydroxy-4-carboxy-5-ureidoimidazoline decarboxylase